uniref:Protein kinase domain-containing protein n=1 Tax=Phytophthora ramorum TaxID=164328 RepID=H3HCY2_PHYRM
MCIMLAKLSEYAGVRQNFLEMRKRRVGEKQPLLYEEEAAFEYAAGNKMVAEEILERAVDNDAMTPNEKEELLRRVLAGRAGWVAAFSGSPQEQKLLALKARVYNDKRFITRRFGIFDQQNCGTLEFFFCQVNGKKYIKLEQIGSGGSSKVYRMLGPDLKIYALKKIKLKRLDAESIAQYTNEINLLSKLQGNPHIIELIAAEQDLQQRQINVIMEHGEIDLSERLRDLNGGMDENLVRVIWTQMLQAVDAIHTARIIHGDLKPANFLFVNGALKLIDFGIAKAISNDTTNIERDSQIGTVNFMSPEAIQGNTMPNGQRHPEGKMKVGRASDIWSLGGGSSATVPPTTSVTMTNASEVLSQLGDLLRSRGVATSRVNMFMSIGQEGLRNSNNGVSRTHRYFYNTQERRTDI